MTTDTFRQIICMPFPAFFPMGIFNFYLTSPKILHLSFHFPLLALVPWLEVPYHSIDIVTMSPQRFDGHPLITKNSSPAYYAVTCPLLRDAPLLSLSSLKSWNDCGMRSSKLYWKKKWSHFDLKSWVTGGTKIQSGIPSNWRIFESNT